MPQDRAISYGIKTPALIKKDFARSLAYVIGINEYSNGIPKLRTAVADAAKLGQLLADSHGYQVQSYPRDGSPTLANLRDLLQRMQQEVGPNDRVLFYFAGHGIALDGEDGPEGYLVPEDANREERTSFLSMVELNEAISKLPCRHFLLILDCCFAGAFRWSSTRDLSPLPNVIHKERYERYIQDPAWQVLTSAAYDQKALDVLSGSAIGQRVETDRHSPFAEALFRALEGEADLIPRGKDGQPGGDGVITATELYLHLRESVETATVEQRMRQTPGLWPLKKHDKGEYILLSPGQELNLPPAPELNYSNNPYRGLLSFDEEHSRLFFGREGEIEELHKLVSSQSLTVVLGASGTGKSSLVKAGLLPILRSSATEKWLVLPAIRVGRSPLAELASLLLPDGVSANKKEGLFDDFRTNENAFANRVKNWEEANPDASHLLLTVDQFEELITLCKDTKEKDLFIAQLANAILSSPVRFRLILTLRTDFEPQFLDCSLKTYWMNGRYIIPPMSTDDLRQAIEGPASTRVLYLKPSGLIDLLVDEVIQTPGALPLLSFTMSELYVRYVERQDDDRCLTLADYEELGGVAGSLRSRASKLYDGLENKSQLTLKRLMLRMVSTDGGNTARRRVPKSELEYASKDENVRVATVLQLLSDARLVVEGKESDDAPYVEPAHDELIRGWDKLLAWMRDEKEELLLRSLLTPAANDWLSNPKATWHANPRLTLLKRISMSEDSWLNKVEDNFVERSLVKRNNVLIGAFSFVATAFIAISLVAFYANFKRVQSERNLSEANRQKANAYWQFGVIAREQNLCVGAAFRFLQAAQACGEAGSAIDLLHQKNFEFAAQSASSNLVRSFPHDERVEGVRICSDYSRVLTWSFDGAVKLWEVTRPEPLKEWKHDDQVDGAEFTRDGYRAITWGTNGTLKLWDVSENEPLKEWKHDKQVSGAMFSRDENRVLSWSLDGAVKLWDVNRPEPLQEWKHKYSVECAAFSYNESCVLTTSENNGKLMLFDVTKPNPLRSWTQGNSFLGAVVTRDGSRVLSWSTDGEVKLWDVAKSEPLQVWKHDKEVHGAVFNQNESRVLTWTGDNRQNDLGEVNLWDVNQAEPLQAWKHDKEVHGAEFTRDESRVLSWGDDGAVKLWDVTRSEPLQEWKHAENKEVKFTKDDEAKVLYGLETFKERKKLVAKFTSDESRVLSWGTDGTVKLWDVKEPEPVQVWEHGFDVLGAEFIRNESQVLAWSADGAVTLWDIKRAEALQVWKYDRGFSGSVFQCGDSRIVTFSEGGLVNLWDMTGAEPLQNWKHEKWVNAAVFSRDNSRVLTWSGDGALKLWDVTKSDPIQEWKHNDLVREAVFTRDESRVLAWSNDGAVKLWDVAKSEPIQTWHHERWVVRAVFTRDESRVLTWSDDGAVKLWDVRYTEPLYVWKFSHGAQSSRAAFIRDDSRILAWSRDGEFRIWDVTKGEIQKDWKIEGFCGAVLNNCQSHLVAGASNGEVYLWNVTKGEIQQTWKHESDITNAVFTRDDSRVLTLDSNGTLKLWDVTKAEPVQTWRQADSNILFGRDGSKFLTYGNGIVKFWDVKKADPLNVWMHEQIAGEQDGGLFGSANAGFSRDETRVLATFAHVVRIYDVTESEQQQLWKHKDVVNGAEFSRDESRILSWCSDGTLWLFDVAKPEPLHGWKHDDRIRGAAFNRDESRLLSWGDDGAVKLWNVELSNHKLTPAERITELMIRSGNRIDSAGQLIPLSSEEWRKLLRSSEYAAIKKKLNADGRRPSN